MLRLARNDGLLHYRLDDELTKFQASSQHLVNISLKCLCSISSDHLLCGTAVGQGSLRTSLLRD